MDCSSWASSDASRSITSFRSACTTTRGIIGKRQGSHASNSKRRNSGGLCLTHLLPCQQCCAHACKPPTRPRTHLLGPQRSHDLPIRCMTCGNSKWLRGVRVQRGHGVVGGRLVSQSITPNRPNPRNKKGS
jgi:hypothetical protein